MLKLKGKEIFFFVFFKKRKKEERMREKNDERLWLELRMTERREMRQRIPEILNNSWFPLYEIFPGSAQLSGSSHL